MATINKPVFRVATGLVACQPAEEAEVHRTSGTVALAAVPDFLARVDALAQGLDVAALGEMTASVPLDEEKQALQEVIYEGEDTTLVYHVWREHADSVHLYFATPSPGLAEALEAELAAHGTADRE